MFFDRQDLKKQTAIRLAHEQQQGRSVGGVSFAGTQSHGAQTLSARQPMSTYPACVPENSHHYPAHPHPSMPHPESMVSPVHGTYRYDQNMAPVDATPSMYTDPRSSRSMSMPSITSSDSSKAKLPHGLTVHELKEMTKARLQAEASDKREAPCSECSTTTSTRAERDSKAPSPTTGPSPPPPPPGAPGLNHRNLQSPYLDSSFNQESWSNDSRNNNEAWETGSASTQASSYMMGAEQSFGTASSFPMDDMGAPNRTRSFSANNAIGMAPASRENATSSPGLPVFETGISFTPNRRRAVTLSPRLGLSHLHEDRPVFLGKHKGPSLPAFSSSRTATPPPVLPRSKISPFMPSDQGRFDSSGFHVGSTVESNRERTSSAASMPGMSRTAEDFSMDSGPLSGFVAVLEDHVGGVSVTGLSDVFREPPGVPTADSSNDYQLSQRGSSDDSFGEPRERASTWCAPTRNAVDMFGPGLISRTAGTEDALADDLASILKLSGAEGKHPSSGLV